MSREDSAFYAGLAIVAVGLIVWLFRPGHGTSKSELEFLGFRFNLDVPALTVMVIGIALMGLSPTFHPSVEPITINSVGGAGGAGLAGGGGGGAAGGAGGAGGIVGGIPGGGEAAAVRPLVKKVVCTGQIEKGCPGPHDIFYTCGYYGSDDEIADKVCTGIKKGVLRTKTVAGNMCGYALIEVTCQQ